MTTNEQQDQPTLPLGFIYLHFAIGYVIALIVTAPAALIYNFIDEPGVIVQFAYFQSLIAGFYLGYRYQKSHGALASPSYGWLIAVLCVFGLLDVVIIGLVIFVLIDLNNLDIGFSLLDEIGLYLAIAVFVFSVAFHILLIGMGFKGGMKLSARAQERRAKKNGSR